MIGVLFGMIAIIWGIATKKFGGRKLAIIGGCGIAFTILLYSCLFYFGFVKRGGVYDDLRANISESNLVQLVQAIEFYKTQNGIYPKSLEILKKSLPENSMVFIYDATDVKMGGKPRYYYYELIDEVHYYLLGFGPDGKPFTADDIVPKMHLGTESKVGLKIKSTNNL